MLQKNNIHLLIYLAVALVLTGCSRKVVYSHYEPTPIDGWEKNDTLSFTVVPIRHEGMYLEEVGLRTSGIYPFTGLTLIVEQRATPSGMMRSDTLHARLIDRRARASAISSIIFIWRISVYRPTTHCM